MPEILPPLSLYIHLPWCVRKCPYCDFNSHKAGAETPKARYIDALLVDLEAEARRVGNRELISVFFGGGTPSLFSPEEIASIIDAVDRHFILNADTEVTMEANPGTVECGDPEGYREAGLNRLSIGAQSFSPGSLQTLGRIHSVGDIKRAFDEARSAGFDNINLDLMFALPAQQVGAALDDLSQAIALGPDHISWYQLTLEPNTVFFARPPDALPDNDLCYEIQVAGQALLRDHGYEQYEVSAYARNGRVCRHNLNYWQFGDYVAVGAGAHGKISGETGSWRYLKPANPAQYMQTIEEGGVTELELVDDANLLFEFMLGALRLSAGVEERLFARRTGLDVENLRDRIIPLREKGLLAAQGDGQWQPTSLGWRFLNDLQAEFLPESTPES